MMTELHEQRVREELSRLVEVDRTPAADIDRARRTAQRTRRTRRVLAAAPITALVVAVGAGVAVRGDVTPPTGPVLSAAPVTAGNPLTVPISFGRLPDGFAVEVETWEDGWYTATARTPDDDSPWGKINLTIYPPGPEPRPRVSSTGKLMDPSSILSTDPVQGTMLAHWITPERGEARLRFQTPSGRWAELSAGGGTKTSSQLTALVRETAEDLDLTPRPASLPFQVRGLPGGFTFRSGHISESRDVDHWSVDMSFSEGLSISLNASTTPPPGAKPNTTIDGHPAYHVVGTATSTDEVRRTGTPVVGTEILCIYDPAQPALRLTTEPPTDGTATTAAELLRPIGGLAGLYRRITMTPEPATWTTTPLIP